MSSTFLHLRLFSSFFYRFTVFFRLLSLRWFYFLETECPYSVQEHQHVQYKTSFDYDEIDFLRMTPRHNLYSGGQMCADNCSCISSRQPTTAVLSLMTMPHRQATIRAKNKSNSITIGSQTTAHSFSSSYLNVTMNYSDRSAYRIIVLLDLQITY